MMASCISRTWEKTRCGQPNRRGPRPEVGGAFIVETVRAGRPGRKFGRASPRIRGSFEGLRGARTVAYRGLRRAGLLPPGAMSVSVPAVPVGVPREFASNAIFLLFLR
ncbi:hypothetical protein SCMC78_14820 [Streptomyces sp. CMC78]|uniref:Uncharacterized protein n=1 Tax=Streptomyces sp. CMC78 TaxID=3231512 RepID=A0AB33KFV4_9ACTN